MTGKLAWHMNPDVRRTLEFVSRLKDIAFAYDASSSEKSRAAAAREWDKALSEMGLGAPARREGIRTARSRRAA